jgi:hypothetical protein
MVKLDTGGNGGIDKRRHDTQHNDIQHNDTRVTSGIQHNNTIPLCRTLLC